MVIGTTYIAAFQCRNRHPRVIVARVEAEAIISLVEVDPEVEVVVQVAQVEVVLAKVLVEEVALVKVPEEEVEVALITPEILQEQVEVAPTIKIKVPEEDEEVPTIIAPKTPELVLAAVAEVKVHLVEEVVEPQMTGITSTCTTTSWMSKFTSTLPNLTSTIQTTENTAQNTVHIILTTQMIPGTQILPWYLFITIITTPWKVRTLARIPTPLPALHPDLEMKKLNHHLRQKPVPALPAPVPNLILDPVQHPKGKEAQLSGSLCRDKAQTFLCHRVAKIMAKVKLEVKIMVKDKLEVKISVLHKITALHNKATALHKATVLQVHKVTAILAKSLSIIPIPTPPWNPKTLTPPYSKALTQPSTVGGDQMEQNTTWKKSCSLDPSGNPCETPNNDKTPKAVKPEPHALLRNLLQDLVELP